MTTKTELIQWLQSPDAIRVVLVEVSDVDLVGGGSTSYFFSSIPYISTTVNYDPIVVGGISFTESISLDGSASIGFGDIELENVNGERDSCLEDYWDKREINIFVGDVRWPREDFYQIFGGLVASLTSRDRNLLSIILVDKLQKLNDPIQTRKLQDFIGGALTPGSAAEANKDFPLPIVLGEVFNVEGVPCSNVTNDLRYLVNDGPIADIIEVRDNGIPVNFTPNVSNGTFVLNQASYGQITCQVQGLPHNLSNTLAGTGAHSCLNLVKYLLTSIGDQTTRFTWATDIDTTQFDTLATTAYGNTTYNDVRMGIYTDSTQNKLDLIQQLLSSVGLHLVAQSNGKLKVVQVALPTNNISTGLTYIGDEDFEFASCTLSDSEAEGLLDPVYQVRIGFNKNYTLQSGTGLAGAVPDSHKSLYGEEFMVAEDSDDISLNPYKLSTALPAIQETAIIDKPAADIEASRRKNIWSKRRRIVNITGYAHLLPIELGQHVHIKTNRFNLDAGKNGIVVSTDRNWLTGRISIGILI